jgi:hypothetical protein
MAKQYDLRLHEIEEKIVKTYIIWKTYINTYKT